MLIGLATTQQVTPQVQAQAKVLDENYVTSDMKLKADIASDCGDLHN